MSDEVNPWVESAPLVSCHIIYLLKAISSRHFLRDKLHEQLTSLSVKASFSFPSLDKHVTILFNSEIIKLSIGTCQTIGLLGHDTKEPMGYGQDLNT